MVRIDHLKMHQKERIYYLDWLRVSAFGILLLFHSWQPFTNFNWLLNSNNKTIVADIFTLILLKPIFPAYTSVADFFIYAFFFVYGFILIKEHGRLLPILNKNNTLLLILGIVSSLLLIGFLLNEPLRQAAFNPAYHLNHVIVSVPIGLSAFSWTLYFVSLFSRKFNFNNKVLAELNRSVLPVYIVHQSIIVVAGFYIIRYVDNGFLEFILIVLTTIIGSMLVYYFIKMFTVTRFIFGLRN